PPTTRELRDAEFVKGGSALARSAMDLLRDVKCQQSYSSGWSGSLKLPIAEGGVNSAVSLAMNQSSLPEIVDRYRSFLEAVSSKYIVIIGIDEVDKLESDEKAERFLNDAKALF